MDKLKLFLVGGFLGSGKTTAIQQAAGYLLQNKRRVGVITNDQGLQQVDTQFIKANNIPSREVAEGCFCCNYNELEKSIASLQASDRPEIIFAESVGSCTDLAATVINPMLSFNPDEFEIVLSVFADIRLLVSFLQNDGSIFYDNVNYIYQKQLEEADVIVVNKIDLLTEHQLMQAKELIEQAYAGKVILYQNSLSVNSIREWLTVVNEFDEPGLRPSLHMDYDIYGAGEAELAWLDEEIGIVCTDNTAVAAGYLFMNSINNSIAQQGYPIGHVKFLIDNGIEQKKISFTSVAAASGAEDNALTETDRVIVLVNARVQVAPPVLQKIVADVIIATELAASCKIIENKLSAFKPGYPKPTHRVIN